MTLSTHIRHRQARLRRGDLGAASTALPVLDCHGTSVPRNDDFCCGEHPA